MACPTPATAPLVAPTRTARDARGRTLEDLRLSLTDRCNLRCAYCMPEEDYVWLPREDVLDAEEVERLVRAFVAVGVTKVRLTGGEPLVRADAVEIVARLAAIPGVRDLALTTNATLLAPRAAALAEAGLDRVTVSLDTLRPDRHRALTRRDNHAAALAGLRSLDEAGFRGTKVNAVVVRDVNDDELDDLLALGAEVGAEVRFIEYMDVGGATGWTQEAVVGAAEILERLAARHGPIDAAPAPPSAPARRYRLGDGRTFGIVSSVSAPFCHACGRSRVTADGRWFHCLYAAEGTDLRAPLRAGLGVAALAEQLAAGWAARADQGAVDRLAASPRAAVPVQVLRRDPHLEMHTRGG